MRYDDIIEIRGGKAAYVIADEQRGEWETFIPNEQFNKILRMVLSSVRGTDIDVHKSFWINGTYGTGKSHAAAVIAHLLSDDVEAVRQWVEDEYGGPRGEVLRAQLYAVRRERRLLPVRLYGLCGMTHAADLALVLQQAITATLAANGIEACVATDFETYAEQVRRNPAIWDHLIASSPALSSTVGDREQLIGNLADEDLATYHNATEALRESGLDVRLEAANMRSWLLEVEARVRATSPYDGLLIMWDEFTDVMTDAIGLSVLKAMQELAEAVMPVAHATHFFLISHPSAFDKLASDARKQTDGRYHVMKYNMEAVSAVTIMSHKFRVTNAKRHDYLTGRFYESEPELLDVYTQGSSDVAQTRRDLRALFPLHPATANLSAHYATVIGSSSRSVFEFLGQNPAIRDFLSSEREAGLGHLITADYLWDYVLPGFYDNAVSYGAVTERWNSYRQSVTRQGAAYVAVFKGVLLLNAFNNVSEENHTDLVTPSEENVRRLFAGTQYAADVDKALAWMNDEAVIQRAPGGMYSVQFSALPNGEIVQKKDELERVTYRFTQQILKYGDTATKTFRSKLFAKSIRPYSLGFYSDVGNEASLRSQIRNGRRDTKAAHLFLALLWAKDNAELGRLRDYAERFTADATDPDMRGVVFIVFDEVLTQQGYDQFIEYQANAECAASHGFLDQTQTHRKNSADLIAEWVVRAGRGNATIYLAGEEHQAIAVRHLPSIVTTSVAPAIFPAGPDAHDMLRQKSPSTFWKEQNSQQIVRSVLFADTRDTLLEGMTAQMKPLQYLLQDALDENLEWLPDVSDDHPLRAVANKVRSVIAHSKSSDTFNLDEKFRPLTLPPFGLYGSFASMAMVAFALRPWVGKIFDMQGKPRDANALVGDISLLFKVWDDGKSASRLNFRFQTKEEGKLCRTLVDVFALDKGGRHTDISSLKAARYALISDFAETCRTPLWAVKYAPKQAFGGTTSITEEISFLTDNLVRICQDEEALRNPSLVTETLRLFDKNNLDYKIVVRNQAAFAAGFRAFLQGVEGIAITEAETEEVWEYIRHNLQSTVGYWTEEEVSLKATQWRAMQAIPSPPNDKYTIPEPEPVPPVNEPEPPRPVPVAPQRRSRVLERVAAITTLDEAKSLLTRLCEIGDERMLSVIDGAFPQFN